jgi:hypothetical protein
VNFIIGFVLGSVVALIIWVLVENCINNLKETK